MSTNTQRGGEVAVPQSVVAECVEAALLAPSSHNTQPWRFRAIGEYLDLVADRTRALPVNDPYDRELTISCGAALFNLRVAAAARSWNALVDELPFPDDPDILARITLCSGLQPNVADAATLDGVLKRRRTYRRKFLEGDVDPALVESLVRAAEMEDCFACPLTDGVAREAAAALVAEGDRQLWSDPHWRRELSSWMHPQRQREGFAIPGMPQRAAELVVRSFDLGTGIAAHNRQLLQGSPLLLVIGSKADEPCEWLRTGQALQRVLLTACAMGLQASFLNQPVHVDGLRSRLRELAPEALVPQILLRLGRPASELAAVPRRSLQSVCDVAWLST
jgi:nitroreductase